MLLLPLQGVLTHLEKAVGLGAEVDEHLLVGPGEVVWEQVWDKCEHAQEQ